ncbi:MAG: 4Fe-4S dicluster domain-containing protein [Deltaproteobacteria bacterium]|nr:4Fe-4S dicluster domain-containing protein [Deltaproteobacteria bacterium]
MQLGFYFDQNRCTGCDACTVACKDLHAENLFEEPADWRWVVELESGAYPHPSVHYIALSCLHCAQPSCIEACPAGAIEKRAQDGIVVVHREQCLGRDVCGAPCREACPYDAVRFGPEPDARMQKCDFCLGRWEDGQLPVCVTACPMRALDAGDIEELRRKYGDDKEMPGFEHSEANRPSLVVKARKSI